MGGTTKMGDQIVEKLIVKNFMGIKRLTFEPQPDINKIEGPNASGKTSTMRALAMLTGSRVDSKTTVNPIRNGEDEATVTAELTRMTLTKTWKKSGKSRLQVLSKDKAVYPHPLKMLEELIGPLPYDPTRFMDLPPKEQTKVLLSLIETDEDFDDLEAQKKKAYTERTGVNRLVKSIKAKMDSYQFDFPDAPSEEESLSELSRQLTEALAKEEQHRVDIGTRKINHESIESKKGEIKRLNNEINQIIRMDDELLIKMNDYVDPDMVSIRGQIENIEETNKQVRYMQEKANLEYEYDTQKAHADSLTNDLDEIEATKEYVIKNANMPIEGISFDDNGLTFEGKPLVDCSTAERLKVCLGVAVGTHHKTEHNIKIMLLHHGNNLDKKSMEFVKEFCSSHGYQVWIEIVADEPSGTGIFIEDGEVKDGN